MRNISEWCAVCVEEMTKRSYTTVDPIENPVPASRSFTIARPASTTIRFDNLVPNGQIRWFVNNTLAQSGGTTFSFKTASLRAGVHRVSVEVTDPTPLVRKDPTRALVNSRTWSASVTDSTLADLAITTLSAPQSAEAGKSIEIETVVTNRGGGAAGSFRVESFLSMDQTVTTEDTFLGHATVAALARNATVRVKRTVRLPFFLDRRGYWLASWVDRLDEVEENDDANNIAMRALQGVGVVGCPTRLEFQMPLTWPVEEHTHSLAAGGTTVMALTAPCRVNEWYLVLWGCSGTTPGTPLPPYTLPLNIDTCTSLALAGVERTVLRVLRSRVVRSAAVPGRLTSKGAYDPTVYRALRGDVLQPGPEQGVRCVQRSPTDLRALVRPRRAPSRRNCEPLHISRESSFGCSSAASEPGDT